MRALSFIASEECIPLLKRALRDADPWVLSNRSPHFSPVGFARKNPQEGTHCFSVQRIPERVFHLSLWLTSRFSITHPDKLLDSTGDLLTALWKERGGKRLIFASVPLWFASSLVTFVAAILWLIVPFAFLGIVVPIVVTIAGFFIAVVVAFLLLVLSILVLTVPVWSHIAFVEPKPSRLRSLGLSSCTTCWQGSWLLKD